MATKRTSKLTDQIRQAIDDSGQTRYRIAQETGIDESTLAKFYNGTRGLSLNNLDLLAGYLGLRVVMDRKAKRGECEINTPLMGGKIHSKDWKGWTITWEADGDYRHWCIQHPVDRPHQHEVAVVMLNPGSLKGFGEKLANDLTLRNLRLAFEGTGYNCLALNLFDLATRNSTDLVEKRNWNRRDKRASRSIVDTYPLCRIKSVMYAYGDCIKARYPESVRGAIQSRIDDVDRRLAGISKIEIPRTKRGMPAHPRTWVTNHHLQLVRSLLKDVT